MSKKVKHHYVVHRVTRILEDKFNSFSVNVNVGSHAKIDLNYVKWNTTFTVGVVKFELQVVYKKTDENKKIDIYIQPIQDEYAFSEKL